jgi:hypothetical protein
MRKWLVAWMRVPALLLAAGTVARAAEHVVLVADTRRFSGWEAQWTNLYNESRFWFAAATIVTVPALSLAMGKLTGLVLSRLGINLKSRVLAEH